MKRTIIFAFLFLAVVCCALAQSDCDPDSNGQPDCGAAKDGDLFRNFWDPTAYWKCANGVAQLERCDTETLYDPALKTCVNWQDWDWVPPCPDANA